MKTFSTRHVIKNVRTFDLETRKIFYLQAKLNLEYLIKVHLRIKYLYKEKSYYQVLHEVAIDLNFDYPFTIKYDFPELKKTGQAEKRSCDYLRMIEVFNHCYKSCL